jgi:phage terminase large subunit-like protein
MKKMLLCRLERLEKIVRAQNTEKASAEAASAQVIRAALRTLGEQDLCVLRECARAYTKNTSAGVGREIPELGRYRAALDEEALRVTGRPWPSEELPLAGAAIEMCRRAHNKLDRMFPEHGPLRRELYPKHLEFFAAGATETERCFMAGNRIGKTEAGAYETTLHLTGRYPGWWEGRRFQAPVTAWVAGETHTTVREILQEKLLGPAGAPGTGMLPADAIHKVTRKPGVAEAVESIYVRHGSGGLSRVVLKSYQEGRESFQGTGVDVVWLDEEVPESIYLEALTRLLTTRGIVMLTFTPLKGLTAVVLRFLAAPV